MDSLGDGIEPTAVAEDGSVEALHVIGHRIAGICWHPEREQPLSEDDVRLLKTFFSLGAEYS